MNNNIFSTINEIDFDKIAVTNVDELCLEEYLKCNLIIDRKLRNIIIIFVTIVLLCNEPLEKQETSYYDFELSIIICLALKKILNIERCTKEN